MVSVAVNARGVFCSGVCEANKLMILNQQGSVWLIFGLSVKLAGLPRPKEALLRRTGSLGTGNMFALLMHSILCGF